ncbi:MerR family transcriptional regulator [Pedobacter sp.]|uniref:MerR family transcriptional regulator n=1 Tax=Pedobacter sp. TaxID=1411316 RepID=UPI003D7FB462
MHYSISDLEKLSGVQAHTIRIWEQRYDALKPLRSAGNTRHYEDNQLKRLLNIVSLKESGMRIAQICALSTEQMNAFIQKEMDANSAEHLKFEPFISQLLVFGLAYNDEKVDSLLSTCMESFGVDLTYQNIIYPLLVRLGLLWQKTSICPAQEHFMSNLIRQKLFAAINVLPMPMATAKTWLLFLPEDEGHDIGLLYAKYVLKNNGEKVIYLGSYLPMSSLIEAMQDNRVDHLLFFMVHSRLPSEAQHYIKELTKYFPDTEILLSGNPKLIGDLALPKTVNWFKDIESLENFIHAYQSTS